MNEIRFKVAEEKDISRINGFYNNYYKINRTYEQFRWEFEECPAGKAIYTMAVDENDNILGIQAGIPITIITSSNDTFLSIKSEDTLVNIDACSQYKKRDVFKELYTFFIGKCKLLDARCIWGFTYALKPFKRIGFEIPFRSKQLLLVIHPSKAYLHLAGLNPKNKVSDKLIIAALSLFSFFSGWKRFLIKPGNFSFHVTEGISSNIALFREMTDAGGFLAFIEQNEKYLQWRIGSNLYPVTYRCYNFFKSNQFCGQVIISYGEDKSCYIEQMLFSKDLSSIEKQQIVKEVVKRIRELKKSLIRFMAFDHHIYHQSDIKILNSSGFFLVNKGIGFVYMDISSQPNQIRPEDLYLSRLYTQGQS
jgi:hypothetical protein